MFLCYHIDSHRKTTLSSGWEGGGDGQWRCWSWHGCGSSVWMDADGRMHCNGLFSAPFSIFIFDSDYVYIGIPQTTENEDVRLWIFGNLLFFALLPTFDIITFRQWSFYCYRLPLSTIPSTRASCSFNDGGCRFIGPVKMQAGMQRQVMNYLRGCWCGW